MLVIISVASLSSGHLEILVQRPQHHANAARIYQSFEQVKATLLNFGIADKILDESLKLLPQLGTGERLNFPPVDVPHHDLVAEGSSSGSDRVASPTVNTLFNSDVLTWMIWHAGGVWVVSTSTFLSIRNGDPAYPD